MGLKQIVAAAIAALSLTVAPAIASANPAHARGHHHANRNAHRHHRKVARIALLPHSSSPSGPVAVTAPKITGVTYYVSPSGSDQNSGLSPEQAWRTVGRVNQAQLQPGDGVLFEGGKTFDDSDLEPPASGTAGHPIVFGSYGSSEAILPKGAWFVDDYLAFENLTFHATFFGGSEVHGTSSHDSIEHCTITLPTGNSQLGLYTNGDDWTIDDDTIENTGLSGMLLSGQGYQISGNTIDNVGLKSVGYNAHGIYLDASQATITQNTITNFSESAVSARYHDSTIAHNYFSGGQIGIDFYQTDATMGTSHWTQNTITHTTDAGLYVSQDGVHALGESFVITGNSIQPSHGVYTNLLPTRGHYSVRNNLLIR